jgi:hypothetical protein
MPTSFQVCQPDHPIGTYRREFRDIWPGPLRVQEATEGATPCVAKKQPKEGPVAWTESDQGGPFYVNNKSQERQSFMCNKSRTLLNAHPLSHLS